MHGAASPRQPVWQMLRLYTLGELRLETDDGRPLLRRPTPLVLLAYLARRVPRSVPRAELAGLLWGDRPEARARQSLRQALLELHRLLGDRLVVTSDSVRLAPGSVLVDAAEFERDVEAGGARDREAVARWTAEFLHGVDDRAESALRVWIESERAGLRRRLTLAFERLVDDAERRGANREAMAVSRRWAELAPLDENACRRLILALRRDGGSVEALACHSSFVTRMKEALELEPSSDFLRLARSLDESLHLHRSNGASMGGGTRAAPASMLPFVGREAAFAALTSAWQTRSSRAATIAVIQADPGLGSTRLCAEFASWCRNLPGRTLVLTAGLEPGDGTQPQPYHSARAVLLGLAAAPALGGLAPERLSELAFLLPRLRERFVHLPPLGDAPALSELTQAVRDALDAAADDGPVLVVLGRVSNMDADSRALLLPLLSSCRGGAMFILVVPDGGSDHEVQLVALRAELGVDSPIMTPPLAALSVAEVCTLLDATARLHVDDRDALAALLREDTGGLPRYVAPAIEALVDERLLTSGSAMAAGVMARLGHRPLPCPARAAVALRDRLPSLGGDATLVLEAAVVLGVAFRPSDIERVAGLQAAAHAGPIEELERSGWVLRLDSERWIVAPPMLQRALYSLIPPLRREALHAGAAALGAAHAWQLDAAARSRRNYHRERAGRRQTSHRVGRWIAVAAVLVLAFATALLLARRRPAPAASTAQTVAIFPFAVSGGSDVEFLRTGMVDLLSTSLDGAAGLHTIDPRVVIAAASAAGANTSLTPPQGLEIARRLGASHFVLGTVVSAGGRLNASAILYEVRHGNTPAARATAAGSEANLFDVVDRISAQLAATQGSASDQRITQLAAVTTTSLEALKAYLAGRNAYRANDLFLALSSYQRAVAADSTFALAWYGLASTASWMMRADIERAAAAQAERQGARLPPRDRTLIEAFAAYSIGSADSAERLARYVTETYDDIEGWVLLGEVLYHHNWKRGRSLTESRQAWQRVLALDSTYWPALQHLAEVASVDGHPAEADLLLARYQRSVGKPHMMIASRAMRAYAYGDSGIRAAVDPQLANDRGFWLTLSVWYVAVLGRDIDDGRLLARHLVEPGRPPEQQGFGRILLAHLALSQGRWKEARAELAVARRYTPVDALEYELLLDMAPFLATAPSEIAATRAALLAQPDSPANNSMAMSWPHTQGALRPMVRSYLTGLTSAREGDEAGRAQSLGELAAIRDPTAPILMAQGFAESIRAEQERMLHHPAMALAHIERGRRATPFLPAWTSGFVSQAYERYLHAELLHELGRDDEALRWYSTFGENSPYDLVYLAPALYRQAQIHDARGNRVLATQRYERFLALWKNCDPEFEPLTAYARSRLALLR